MSALREGQSLFLQDIGKLIPFATSIGVEMTVGEAYRTRSQQLLYFFGNDLYSTGQSLKLIKGKKRSWTMDSLHLDRLAMDFNFFIDGRLVYEHEKINKLGRFWEELNPKNKWGGSWKTKDTPHFQRGK